MSSFKCRKTRRENINGDRYILFQFYFLAIIHKENDRKTRRENINGDRYILFQFYFLAIIHKENDGDTGI